MKAIIHYYDGNDYFAKLVEFKGSAGPFGLNNQTFPDSWSPDSGLVDVTSVIEVPEDTTIAFCHLDNAGYIVVLSSEAGEDCVTLNLEDLEF